MLFEDYKLAMPIHVQLETVSSFFSHKQRDVDICFVPYHNAHVR
jgi:hypothetical protein